MTDASLRYEIEQLKRKLLQTQEERDRAMSNCHELWKRLNSLISLAASTTASYTLSNSGLPTSPSDSYDSRSKSTSPNSSSAASLNDSLLSTSNGNTSNNNNNTNNASNNLNNNTNNNNNNNVDSSHAGSRKLSNGNNQPTTTLHHHAPLNLKSINAIKNNHHHHNNNSTTSVFHAGNDIHQFNGNTTGASNNISNHNHMSSNISINNNNNNNNTNNSTNHHSPLNLKSINAIKDINNNHPLIAEVAKVTTVGEIEEIAPGQFKCRYCDKTFDRIFSVHRHERVHTGFKPCVCKACGRGFSEKRNLRHHIIRFHSDGSGRELLKRNRNKSSNAANNSTTTTTTTAQQQQIANTKQQMKQLSAAASFLNGNHNISISSSNNNNSNSQVSPPHQHQHQHHHLNSSSQNRSPIQTVEANQLNSSLLNNSHLSSTSSQITATINRLQNIKNEPIDTTGLNVLGAAAAVITVSSSSSRRRKSKPSKKINY